MIFVVNGLDFHCDLLDLIESSIIHPLLESVFPDEFFNVDAGLLEVDLEQIDFLSKIEDGVLIDITLNPE